MCEVDKIIAKIDELIAALTTGLTGAFAAVGRTQVPDVEDSVTATSLRTRHLKRSRCRSPVTRRGAAGS